MFSPDSSQAGSFAYDLIFSLELIRLQKQILDHVTVNLLLTRQWRQRPLIIS
jgi:hypothetical protein